MISLRKDVRDLIAEARRLGRDVTRTAGGHLR
jgi:hypothetical protein